MKQCLGQNSASDFKMMNGVLQISLKQETLTISTNSEWVMGLVSVLMIFKHKILHSLIDNALQRDTTFFAFQPQLATLHELHCTGTVWRQLLVEAEHTVKYGRRNAFC